MARASHAIAAALAVIVWAVGGMPLHGRQQNPPQFRARTDLVQVDVVVLDADGRPVRGLRASDFTILDRRKPQPVRTFTEISHGDADLGAGVGPPADVRLDVADNATAKSQRAIVLVIHDLGTWVERVDKVKAMARRIVNDLGADASMGLVFSSGRGGVELTEDRAALIEAIDRFEGAYYAMRRGREEFIRTIQDVATRLSTDQTRRKAIVTLSEGIGGDFLGLFDLMRPRAGGGADDIMMLAMMDALRRANVALYGVDPRGRLQTTEERGRESRNRNPPLRMFDRNFHSQQSLEVTAEASGGFAIVDTNDFEAGLNRIVADLDNYYLLGFYAEDPDSDRWRELEVTVDRPGVTVRHRKGYRGGAKPVKPKNRDPMVRLSEGVLPQTDLRLRLFATPVSLSPKSAKVAVSLEARDPALTGAGVPRDRVSVTILAVDLKRRKVVKRVDRRADVAPGSDEAYQFPFTMDLAPGRYQLRASAASATSGKSGSVYLTLDVPAPPQEGIAIAIAGAALRLPGSGEAAVLDRVFAPEDVLHVDYWIARADPAAAVSSTIEVLDSRGAVVFTAAPQVPIRETAPVQANVALTSLPPGGYRLRMTARSGASEAAREIGFAIRGAKLVID